MSPCRAGPRDGARAGAAPCPLVLAAHSVVRARMSLEGDPGGRASSVRGGMGRWLSQQDGCSCPLSNSPALALCACAAPTGLGMEVMAPPTINALNGSSVKLSCTFNSCYKVENKQFSLNWTYQECWNCSEELVSPAGDLLRGPGTSWK